MRDHTTARGNLFLRRLGSCTACSSPASVMYVAWSVRPAHFAAIDEEPRPANRSKKMRSASKSARFSRGWKLGFELLKSLSLRPRALISRAVNLCLSVEASSWCSEVLLLPRVSSDGAALSEAVPEVSGFPVFEVLVLFPPVFFFFFFFPPPLFLFFFSLKARASLVEGAPGHGERARVKPVSGYPFEA